MKTSRNQKELNTLVNTAVQQILLEKGETQNILNDIYDKYTKL